MYQLEKNAAFVIAPLVSPDMLSSSASISMDEDMIEHLYQETPQWVDFFNLRIDWTDIDF